MTRLHLSNLSNFQPLTLVISFSNKLMSCFFHVSVSCIELQTSYLW